ncbi:MAG TPA: hypothetical protein VNB49_02150 [Candidatus Dormibacteraeota bacterium]|nr:hypothetical protein [Candidatus Dormibacteraeota bacterium]
MSAGKRIGVEARIAETAMAALNLSLAFSPQLNLLVVAVAYLNATVCVAHALTTVGGVSYAE